MDCAETKKCADRLISAIVDRDFYSCVGIGYIRRSSYPTELLCKFCEPPRAAECLCVAGPTEHVSLFHRISGACNESSEFLFGNNDKIVLGSKFARNGDGGHARQYIRTYGIVLVTTVPMHPGDLPRWLLKKIIKDTGLLRMGFGGCFKLFDHVAARTRMKAAIGSSFTGAACA
jgi:hypothetical protein